MTEAETDIDMEENNISEFAQMLTQFRQRHGMSQGQLAQATHVSRTYVYHLETGQRVNPSPRVVQNIARALELKSDERQCLQMAYNRLTGQFVDPQQSESALLDLGELATLLVHNTAYPAYSLDRLWYLHAWNDAVVTLLEIQEEIKREEKLHLLSIVFDPRQRKRFHDWEHLAHRLVSDFMYSTRAITHLPEYKALRKNLCEFPEFRRIAAVAVYPRGKPVPSFVFRSQHSKLGRLTLRTATTVFTGISSYSLVSYVPGDQRTLAIYRGMTQP